MTSVVDSQIPPRTKIGFLLLFGAILALSAEAAVMAALMVMAESVPSSSLRGPEKRAAASGRLRPIGNNEPGESWYPGWSPPRN
jgi:hypothetical protein